MEILIFFKVEYTRNMQLNKTLLHTTESYIKRLKEAGIETLLDLVSLFPRDIEDKSEVLNAFSGLNIIEKQAIQCTLEALHSETTRNNKLIIKAVIVDANGSYAEAVWFGRKFLLQQFHT
jgi:RecG-like helicase